MSPQSDSSKSIASLAAVPPDQALVAHLAEIEKVASQACRKRGFGPEDAEEFVSVVKCKLVENDYAILRKFQGRSSFKTYLIVVTQRLFLDHLNHLRGKWRCSAEAERLGDLAVRLEKMLVRDGLAFDEACEALWKNHQCEASRQELADLAGRFPRRNLPRRREAEAVLENYPDAASTPDQRVLAEESDARLQEVLRLLEEALARLPAEDALIVRMSCELKISAMARSLRLAPKSLYRRRGMVLKALRKELEGRGVRPEEVRGLLGGLEGL